MYYVGLNPDDFKATEFQFAGEAWLQVQLPPRYRPVGSDQRCHLLRAELRRSLCLVTVPSSNSDPCL